MPQEEEEEVLRFSMLVCTTQSHDDCHWKFFTFDEADLIYGFDVKMRQSDAVLSDYDGQMSFKFPHFPGYCRVGRTLFLAGGAHYKEWKGLISSDLLLSFDLDASQSPGDSPSAGLCHWRCNSLFFGRQQCLAVPYESKIFIFGGVGGSDPLPEIYDTLSGKHLPAIDFPKDLELVFPTSYFLWKDSTNPHKKSLILLYSPFPIGHHRLYSYDVEENHWELFDNNFPIPEPNDSFWPRNLIPLDCSDYLVVMDYAAYWSIYDLSSKNLVGRVQVQGLEEKEKWQVIRAFWRLSSKKGSLIFYIFFDASEGNYEMKPTHVPYAKVRFLTQEQQFVATLESTGALEVGKYDYICMFAEQTTKTTMTKRNLDEAPLSCRDDSKKMKL